MDTANVTPSYRTFLVEQFQKTISDISLSNTFLSIGKVNPWLDENNPDLITLTLDEQKKLWNNIISFKKIIGNNVMAVIPRYDWISGTVYTEYSDSAIIENQPFYVMTDEKNVYKCLFNNNGAPSTVKPTSTNPVNVSYTPDGYIWKFMSQISNSDFMKFATGKYIPIRTLPNSDGSLQWLVQQAAIDGSIHIVKVDNGGSGYSNSSNISISIIGDGIGATAIPSVNTISQKIENIIVSLPGSDYTQASVVISGGGGTGANAYPIIDPPGGHGKNPLYELMASSLMINVLVDSQNEKFPLEIDYRQIGIHEGILDYQTGKPASNTSYKQTIDLVLAGTGVDFQQNEWVFQGPSLSGATFKARVVSYDSSNTKIKLTDFSGNPTTATLTGQLSSASKFVSDISHPDIRKYSGKLIYYNNIKPINRTTDQSENFKIKFSF